MAQNAQILKRASVGKDDAFRVLRVVGRSQPSCNAIRFQNALDIQANDARRHMRDECVFRDTPTRDMREGALEREEFMGGEKFVMCLPLASDGSKRNGCFCRYGIP